MLGEQNFSSPYLFICGGAKYTSTPLYTMNEDYCKILKLLE